MSDHEKVVGYSGQEVLTEGLPAENGEGASVPPSPEADEASFRETFFKLWQERSFIAKASLAGLVLATVLAFVISPRYESTTRLMPPDQQSSLGLALLASKVDEQLAGLASQALGFKSSGALFIGILESRTVEDRLVQRFDLRRVYGMKLWKDARERLAGNTGISEDRKSGIITLAVTDKSPQRAAALAGGYVEELDKLTTELTTSAAHRERIFIEGRLKTVKQDLDAASRGFSRFASENTAIDISAQGKAMVEAAARVQGELIAAEAQLSSLKQIYTENNVRVRAAEAQIRELNRQIANLQGTDASLSQADPPKGQALSYPSIRKLPVLGVTYFDLYRQLKIQEAIYEILTKQYELAKIQEVREIPTVRVLDEANIPEKKSSPKRLQLMAFGTFFAGFLAMVYVLAFDRWQGMGADHPVKTLAREIQKGILHDFEQVRSRIPWGKNGANPPAT